MNNENQKYQQSRRDFFTKLALASMAITWPPMAIGCSQEPKFQGSGKAPYKVWEEMLHYVKTSPDYLPGRMERLIEEGNSEAMFNFVRDELYLIPAKTNSIGYGNELKWGVDYVLRSGMATMWEKAVLLNQMYTRAGITSEIVFERTDITPEEVPDFFFRSIKRDFMPEISKSMMRHWANELAVENADIDLNPSLENEVEDAKTLGDKILGKLNLPEDHYYREFDFRWPNHETPTVKFQLENETKFAHLFDPKVPFGNLHSGDASKTIAPKNHRTNEEKVSIKIKYRDSITPLEEKELITGEWLATDLVGNQIDVLFLNNLTLEEMAVTPAGNVRIFTPALSLQAMGKNQKFMKEHSLLGTPITLTGKKILLDETGNKSQVGDSVILEQTDPNLIKQVKTIDVKTRTTGYPGVKLNISAKNAKGESVEGLSANDFSILEDGKPIHALMENNQRTPRILILADNSMSMPAEYYGEGMETFIEQLKKDILEKYPAAIIDFWKTPSSLFTWLLKGSQTENDLIIYATDGHNDDSYNPENETIYKSGPPAIVLNVRNSEYDHYVKTFDKMAEVTNGVHLGITEQTEAIRQISTFIEGLQIQPYAFTYNAVGGTDEREVKVEVDNKRLSAVTTYAFDTVTPANQIGPKIIGLYLEMKYGNQYAVKRVLAGWEYDIHPRMLPSQKMADEVNDLMLGSMQFYFEGAGPTFSAVIADVLQARLSTRNWGEPLFENDIDTTIQAYTKGHFSIDDRALALMSPLRNPASSESFTLPGGMRIGLRTFKPGVITDITYSLFDYLNTSEYHTISRDAKKGFKMNLQRTAQLAIRERAMFQKSTLSELTDKRWIDLKSARKSKWFVNQRENDSNYWRERIDRNAHLRIFDENAVSRAFWNIDKDTGELYGYLPNGSGGGGDQDLNDVMTALMSLIGIMGRYGMIHPVGGLALGIVVQYGKTLTKLYAMVSETIMIMDASGLNDRIANELQKFACEAHVSIILSLFGDAGELMSGLNTLIGQINGKGLYNCG